MPAGILLSFASRAPLPKRLDMAKFIDSDFTIAQQGDDLFRVTKQNIPASFLKQLHDEKHESNGVTASGEMVKLASIPVAVVEHMQREGIDVYKAPVKDIIKWLNNHDMDGFLTSTKRL